MQKVKGHLSVTNWQLAIVVMILISSPAHGQRDVNILEIEAACMDLLARFLVYRDSRDSRLRDLFTVDAELILSQDTYIGRDAIWGRYDRPVPVHKQLLTTMRVTPVDATTATSISYVLLVVERTEFNLGPLNPLEKFFAAAEYHHVYRLTDEGWKIARHKTELIFKNFGVETVQLGRIK